LVERNTQPNCSAMATRWVARSGPAMTQSG
jgi:hypothetical protein